MSLAELNYRAEELKAVAAAARAGGLEALALECEQALELKLPLARCPALQAVVEAWRKQGAAP
jgi:hypothetical protein